MGKVTFSNPGLNLRYLYRVCKNRVSNSVTQLAVHGHTVYVDICVNIPTFQQLSLFPRRENHALKWATIVSILFPIRVAPIKIENSLKEH